MKQPSQESTGRSRRTALLATVACLVVALAGAVGYWLVVPKVADRVVRSKLESVQDRFDLDIEVEEVATTGLSEVSLGDIEVRDATTDEVLARVADVTAAIDGLEVLLGRQHLSSLRVAGATLTVHRGADGTTNLEEILERSTEASPSVDEGGADDDSPEDTPGFLRYFGGSFPDIDVEDARLDLTADKEAEPWPVERLATDGFQLDARGDRADLEARVDISSRESATRWAIPSSADLKATLRLPLHESTGSLAFSSPLEVVDVGPYPFVRLGVRQVGLAEDFEVSAQGLSLGVQGGDKPQRLATIDRFAVRFEEFNPASDVDKLRPLQVKVDRPILYIEHDEQFGSAINDLHHLLRAPFARHIGARAHLMAEHIAEEDEDAQQEPDEEEDSKSLTDKLADVDWNHLLSKEAPQRVEVDEIGVQVRDERRLDELVQSDRRLALDDGRLEFSHRPIHGELVARGGFQATGADEQGRGSASTAVRWNYRKGGLEFEADVDELSVPWLVQMVDGRLQETLRGGYLHADVAARRARNKKRVDIEGLASVEEFSFHHPTITKDPVKSVTASYDFEAFYDPEDKWPEPKLIASKYLDPPEEEEDSGEEDDTNDRAEAPPPLDETPPQSGAFVIERGSGQFNGVDFEVRPAVYGFDGLKRRPARFDLEFRLPRTGVDELFAAVPEAIQGPIAGAEMRGSFAWSLDLEAPLYRAGKMQWDSKPSLRGFELVSLPEEVDVRRLAEDFDLTLVDPELEWERDVEIPEMRPVPIDWLVNHSGRDTEDFEQDRKEREWPPMEYEEFADTDSEDLPEDLRPHKRPWEDEEDDTQADDRNDSFFGLDFGDEPTPTQAGAVSDEEDDPSEEPPMVRWEDEEEEHPYGEYVFVPLQYISPWLIRAVMTTEDNSFFKHSGFNWFALKGSIEDNIEAGGFVRGASTIPMQLVKNLYLSRDKVLARKFQEAFLVWLMESEVDIPKERILELYFNVIEFGPGIFGIHDASVHYFGKRAEDLTLTEVAWLVSIVPQPKKHHEYYERGEISPLWFNRMKRYVAIMERRDRVSEEEYEKAKEDKPEFYKPDDDEPMMRPDVETEQFDDDIEEIDDDDDDPREMDGPRLQDLMGP